MLFVFHNQDRILHEQWREESLVEVRIWSWISELFLGNQPQRTIVGHLVDLSCHVDRNGLLNFNGMVIYVFARGMGKAVGHRNRVGNSLIDNFPVLVAPMHGCLHILMVVIPIQVLMIVNCSDRFSSFLLVLIILHIIFVQVMWWLLNVTITMWSMKFLKIAIRTLESVRCIVSLLWRTRIFNRFTADDQCGNNDRSNYLEK